jgi:hypothetical protein
MTRAVILAWVIPDAQQVLDCVRLAGAMRDGCRAAGRGDGDYAAGVAAAAAWVIGSSPAPITGDDVPPAPEPVEAEFFAAGEVELGRSPRGAVVAVDAAQAVRRTLAWLLGWERRQARCMSTPPRLPLLDVGGLEPHAPVPGA